MNSPFPPSGRMLRDLAEAPGAETVGGGTPTCAPGTTPPPAAFELVSTKGCADVMARRLEQWLTYGHTPEADARLPLHHFARELRSMAAAVFEDSERRGRTAIMRKHVITLAAMALATVDRIDAEPPEEENPL